MSKVTMALGFLLVALWNSCYARTDDCRLAGRPTWSFALRAVISDCDNRFPSPNGVFILDVGPEGTATLRAQRGARKLRLPQRIEAPAMIAWSPRSDGFFVNDGKGSGLSSTFRLFRLKANRIVEDQSIESVAVALYRQKTNCASESVDPNVWGFGWTGDGSKVFLLVQATANESCGSADAFLTMVIREADGAILETLSREQTRRRFASLLPPELFHE